MRWWCEWGTYANATSYYAEADMMSATIMTPLILHGVLANV